MKNTIEDIILSKDGRGISNLRNDLVNDYCNQAAKFVLENKGVVMISTGFYIIVTLLLGDESPGSNLGNLSKTCLTGFGFRINSARFLTIELRE